MHSPDIADLQSFTPIDPVDFGFLLEAMIGPEQGAGEEAFALTVCTPSWFGRRVEENGYALGRHCLFMMRYDYALLRRILQQLCDEAVGQDWTTVATKLGRYGKWEFEDYIPYSGEEM